MKIILIGCSKTKVNTQELTAASDLYVSDLFSKRLRYAEENSDAFFILSAFHGVLHPDRCIVAYDVTLSDMQPNDVTLWHVGAARQLMERMVYDFDNRSPKRVTVEIHAGRSYCSPLAEILTAIGFDVRLPLAGLGIGQQLAWYCEAMKKKECQ